MTLTFSPTLKARDAYEEAIQTVITVRDFSQVFDAYAQFEETMISSKMESMPTDGAPSAEGDLMIQYLQSITLILYTDDLELELRLARLESLMERRPLLLNSVLLRQNPHNVNEWHKRVKLHEGKPREVC